MIEVSSKPKRHKEEKKPQIRNGPVVRLLHRGGNFLDDDSADGFPAGERISSWVPRTVADVELYLHASTPNASTVAFHSRDAMDVVVSPLIDDAIDSSRGRALGAVESEEPAFAAGVASPDAQVSVISDVEVGAGI